MQFLKNKLNFILSLKIKKLFLTTNKKVNSKKYPLIFFIFSIYGIIINYLYLLIK